MGTLSATHRRVAAKDGFTLFEVLLVIAIIGIMSTIALLSFDRGDAALELQRVRFSVEQGLENAKSNAFNGLLHHGDHVESFGVHIKEGENSIVVFADCNGDNQYNEDGQDSTCGANKHSEKRYSIEFEGEFSITDVEPCTSSGCVLSIMFRSPFATVDFLMNNVLQPDGQVGVTDITISNGTLTETIVVNRAGRSTRQV